MEKNKKSKKKRHGSAAVSNPASEITPSVQEGLETIVAVVWWWRAVLGAPGRFARACVRTVEQFFRRVRRAARAVSPAVLFLHRAAVWIFYAALTWRGLRTGEIPLMPAV